MKILNAALLLFTKRIATTTTKKKIQITKLRSRSKNICIHFIFRSNFVHGTDAFDKIDRRTARVFTAIVVNRVTRIGIF